MTDLNKWTSKTAAGKIVDWFTIFLPENPGRTRILEIVRDRIIDARGKGFDIYCQTSEPNSSFDGHDKFRINVRCHLYREEPKIFIIDGIDHSGGFITYHLRSLKRWVWSKLTLVYWNLQWLRVKNKRTT